MKSGMVHAVVAGVLLAGFIGLYQMTAAPTISFWDSAELTASAAVMGVPHPPGAPLLELAGRTVALPPVATFKSAGGDLIAARINLIPVLLAGLTVLLTYLVTVRLLTRIYPFTGRPAHDGMVILGGATAACLAGFADEFWTNAVEFEAYLPALFLSMLTLWLVLVWERRRHDLRSVRLLFFAAYVVGIGMGVHLSVLLIVPALMIVVAAAVPDRFGHFGTWVFIVAVAVLIAAIRILAGSTGLMSGMIVLGLVVPFYAARVFQRPVSTGRSFILPALVCVGLFGMGYSVYPTVMVRAAKNPAINFGDPDTPARFAAYLDRTQYGQGNMLTGVLERTAPAGYQFGYQYLRYLLRQFPAWGPSPEVAFNPGTSSAQDESSQADRATVPILLLLLAAAGIMAQFRHDPSHGLALALWFLATSVGLVLYLNMAAPQVRDRGYFFLASFHIAMIWTGIGIAFVLHRIRAWLPARYLVSGTVLGGLVLFSIIPTAAFTRHLDPQYTAFQLHDRSRNWIPYDYAVNMLESCAPNAILFAQGDNDTFPLWYVQVVDGVRTDVTVVNLSILNAPWYIKQLRDGSGRLPVSFSDEYIDTNLTGGGPLTYQTLLWPGAGSEVSAAGITWTMPPDYVTADRSQGLLMASSLVTLDVIRRNGGLRPVCFSTYLDRSRMLGLDEFCAMDGLVFRLTTERRGENGEYYADIPALAHNLYDVYEYRGVLDPTVYKSPATDDILNNYFVGFLDLCLANLDAGDEDAALAAGEQAWRFTLGRRQRIDLLRNVLSERGFWDRLGIDTAGEAPG